MKLDSRHILILLGLISALSSCVQFSAQEGMAQLYPPVFEVDATVEDLAQTKAKPAKPVPVAPTYPEVHFTVKDKDGNVVYDKLGVWDTPLKLPIGAYSIEAYSGSNKFGSAYFTGTASGTVKGGKEETPKITMKLQNAYLAVGLTETLAKHFKTSGSCITISTTSASIDAALDTYVFVPSGQPLSIAITGTSSADIPKTITHSLAARSAATATHLSCDLTTANPPTITLKGTPEAWGTVGYIPVATTANISDANVDKMVYIAENAEDPSSPIQGKVERTEVVFKNLIPGKSYSVYATIGALKSNQVEMTVATPEISISTGAKHTTNSSSELDGTDFTASISIPEKFKGVVEVVNLTLSDGNNVLRKKTLSASETVWTSDGSVETAWPYLPHGNYTLTGTVSYNNGTKDADLTELTLPVDAPKFDIVSQPIIYTSYSVYASPNAIDGISKGATGANTLDGSSIYIKNGIIADAILSNKNYSKIINYSYSDGERSFNEGQNKDVTWGAHTVNSSFTFDNVIKNFESVTCHVTGLPYKKDFTSDKSTERWEGLLSTSHNLKAICLGYKYGSGTITYKVFSPIFPLPTKTKISYTAVHYYGATGLVSPSGTIYSGVTNDNTTIQTQKASIKGNIGYLTETPTEFPLKDDVEMNNSSRISLSGSCGARGAVENYVELARIEILYRSN